MKNKILVGMALLFVSQAHALISDKFKCSLDLSDTTAKQSAHQEQEFFVARLPLSASPASDVRITAGSASTSLELKTSTGLLNAGIQFYYRHAVKVDLLGNPIEARQTTCLTMPTGYCDLSGPPGPPNTSHTCGGVASACLEAEDPFNPTYGWEPVSLISGLPTFKEGPMSVAAFISDDQGQVQGQAVLNCKYMGTFQ